MRTFFKALLLVTFVLNVVLVYGSATFPLLTSNDTEWSSPKRSYAFGEQNHQKDSFPVSLLLLAEEEETEENNENFLHAAIFIVAFFHRSFLHGNSAEQPKGEYALYGKKSSVQRIFTLLETFRI